MPVTDPFVPIRDWRISLYRGDAADIDRFLDAIETRLPRGWIRDVEFERSRPRPDRIRCYLFDQPRDAAVRVWLQRVTATRVRGGPVQVVRHPPSGDEGRIGQLVAEFASASVIPAASAAGVCCTRPAFGPRDALTTGAEMLFMRLAETAEGQWPLTDRSQALWDELVSVCLAEQVAIDRAELRSWLEDSGWEHEAATDLADRFFADSRSLANRLAMMAP